MFVFSRMIMTSFASRLRSRVRHLIFSETDFNEVLHGLSSISIGLTIIYLVAKHGYPVSKIDLAIPAALNTYAFKYGIGLIFTLAGVTRLLAWLYEQIDARRFIALFTSMLWMFLATTEILDSFSLYATFFILFALSSIWIYLRLGLKK